MAPFLFFTAFEVTTDEKSAFFHWKHCAEAIFFQPEPAILTAEKSTQKSRV